MTPVPPRLVVAHPDLAAPLAVAAGEVALLEGARGALVTASVLGTDRAGRVEVDGRRLRRRALSGRVRRGLAVVAGAPVASDVTVHDHLAAVLGSDRARRALVAAPLLAGRGGDPAGVLSGGERRVLAWLRARAVDPRAVLLDRAGEGLDADTLAWAGQVVATWAAAGVAVMVRPGREEERSWASGAQAHPSPGNSSVVRMGVVDSRTGPRRRPGTRPGGHS